MATTYKPLGFERDSGGNIIGWHELDGDDVLDLDVATLPGTTVGKALLDLTDPSAIRFIRLNADNTVSALSSADFLTAIGAGSSSLVIGTTAGTACEGNDARLFDARVPSAHNQDVSTISDATTTGQNLVKLANPSAIRFVRINADNTVSALSDSDFRTAIGAGTSSLALGTTSSTACAGDDARLSDTRTPTAHNQAVSTISDSTTVGQNLVKLTNPSAITFLRVNADNTVSALSDSDFRTAIGAGTSSLALGDTSGDAYRGDHGKTAYDHAGATTGTPHGTAYQVPATTLAGYGITDALGLHGTSDDSSKLLGATWASPSALGSTTPNAGTFTYISIAAGSGAAAGFIECGPQSAKPTTPAANTTRHYTDATGHFCWIGANGYVRSFDGTANTADHTYTLPNVDGKMITTGNLSDISSVGNTCTGTTQAQGSNDTRLATDAYVDRISWRPSFQSNKASCDWELAISTSPWSIVAFATGTYTTVTSVSDKHPGIISFSSHATNSNSGGAAQSSLTCFVPAGGEEFCGTMYLATTTNLALRTGFSSSFNPGSSSTQGAYLTLAGATLSFVTVNSTGTATAVSTYTVSATTWYSYRIKFNAAYTAVTATFYDETGASLWTATLTTKLPDAALGHGFGVINTSPSGATVMAWLDLTTFDLGRTIQRGLAS